MIGIVGAAAVICEFGRRCFSSCGGTIATSQYLSVMPSQPPVLSAVCLPVVHELFILVFLERAIEHAERPFIRKGWKRACTGSALPRDEAEGIKRDGGAYRYW